MQSTRSLLSLSSLFILLILALAAAPAARAQLSPSQLPTVPTIPGESTGKVPPGSDPLMHSINEKMAIERNQMRQQKIISDSARLLALAQKLNAEVAKSDKDTLSVSVVNEAGEIQKLAKSIKDKMRNGY
jgi:hypothetical protein